MGQLFTFECKSCGYKATVSGGKDRGFTLFRVTCICNECHSLIDLPEDYVNKIKNGEVQPDPASEGKDGKQKLIDIFSEENREFFEDLFESDKCMHRDIEIWDNKKKPCPKCGGKMKKSNNGNIILWD